MLFHSRRKNIFPYTYSFSLEKFLSLPLPFLTSWLFLESNGHLKACGEYPETPSHSFSKEVFTIWFSAPVIL